jgi:hypothetical protein
MSDLFVEIFPIQMTAVPPLVAYRVTFQPAARPAQMTRAANRLAAQFRRGFPGEWHWLGGWLITDAVDLNPIEAVIALDTLKADRPDWFDLIDGLDTQTERDIPADAQANFMIRTRMKPLDTAMQAALEPFRTVLRNARVERESKMRGWSVAGEAAVSISIASRLIYAQSVQDIIGAVRDLPAVTERVAGLWVSDPTSGVRGEIIKVLGFLADERARLMGDLPRHLRQEVIERAPDDELVIRVRAGRREYDYLAGGVKLVVRLSQLGRFDVDAKRAIQTLQMDPATRAKQVSVVSQVAKQAEILGNGYNARTRPEAFFSADFEMNLRFKDNRVRPYNADKLDQDFAQCGTYKLRPDFEDRPVRVAVVNTLDIAISDFVEAMRRQLQRNFPFEIDVIRERRVRVVSQTNLESAVRVVEKENPDIILAFFPDEIEVGDDDDDTDEATATYIKSLTLARGIPTHVIHAATLDDPDAMTGIVLSILGKTGSAPFVLTEPIETADYVIGLDVVRQTFATRDEIRLTAIVRIYRADGEFLSYTVRDMELEENTIPYVLMRDLFPQKQFSGQRVMIHHEGEIAPDLLKAITGWGQAIQATFHLVEIIRFGSPRIYAITQTGITQPPWGSAFKLGPHEALLISSLPAQDITPQPLHIRTVGPAPLPITEALRSVLVWTLLAYGAARLPKLPVTVINTVQLAEWLNRGNRFNFSSGRVPFWL